MKAIFVVPFENDNPQLPPITADSGLQLGELVDGKVRDGCGFSCIGLTPREIGTCMVLVDTSSATIEAMKSDPKYILVEYVAEAVAEGEPAPVKEVVTTAGTIKEDLKTLEDAGYEASLLSEIDLSTTVNKRQTMKSLHQVTDAEYKAVGGTD